MCFFCAEQVLLCPAVFCSSICARVPVYATESNTAVEVHLLEVHLQGLPHLDFAGHPQSYKWYLFAWELEMSRVSTTAEHDINLIVLGGHPLLLDSGEREEEEEGVHVWVVALKVFNIYVNNSKQKL